MQSASGTPSPQVKKDLDKLGGIISKPKFDPYITLVSNALNTASTADALQQIKVIVFQAYAYNATAKLKDKVDPVQLEMIDAVAGALLTPIKKPISSQKDVVSIAWGFEENEENWKKYIEPWKRHFEYYRDRLPEEFKVRLQGGGFDLKDEKSPLFFFGASTCLTEMGYQMLVRSFSHWCIPKVAEYWAAVAKSVVSKKGLSDPEAVNVDVDQ